MVSGKEQKGERIKGTRIKLGKLQGKVAEEAQRAGYHRFFEEELPVIHGHHCRAGPLA